MFAVDNNDTTNKPVPSSNNNGNKRGAGVGSKEKRPMVRNVQKNEKRRRDGGTHGEEVWRGSWVISSVAANGKSNGSGLHDALSKFLSVAGETMNMRLLQSQMAANPSDNVCQRFANSLLEKEVAKLDSKREEMKKQQQSEASYSETNSPPSDIKVDIGIATREEEATKDSSNYQEDEEEEDIYGA